LKGDIIEEDEMQNLQNSIKTIRGVQLIVELTNEKIKNKEHLIF
jgi:hypothetical protein